MINFVCKHCKKSFVVDIIQQKGAHIGNCIDNPNKKEAQIKGVESTKITVALRLKTKKQRYYKNPKRCKKCNKIIHYNRKRCNFCNRSCSNSFSNSQRSLTLETKRKLSDFMISYFDIKGRKIIVPKVKKEKVVKLKRTIYEKNCKHCGILFDEKGRSTCEKCRNEIYPLYINQTRFSFSLKDYNFIFSELELKLLEENGVYKTKLRGNNPIGIVKDHMYSKNLGFKNKIPAFIISHPANCRLILQDENLSKGPKIIISFEELLERIVLFETKILINLKNIDRTNLRNRIFDYIRQVG